MTSENTERRANRGATAEAEAPAQPAEGEGEGAVTQAEATQAAEGGVLRVSMAIQVPVQLKDQLEALAKGENLSMSELVRNIVVGKHKSVEYTGPSLGEGAGGRKKYGTPEEAKAAADKAAKDRRELMSTLLKRHREAQKAEAEAAKVDGAAPTQPEA